MNVNGSAFAAIKVAPRPEQHPRLPATSFYFPVIDHKVDAWSLTLVSCLMDYSWGLCQAGGELVVRAGLVGQWPNRANVDDYQARDASETPVVLAQQFDLTGWVPVAHRHTVLAPSFVDQTLPESVWTSSVDLVSSVAHLVADIVSEFGESEPHFLRRDGTVELTECNGGILSAVRQWAATNGVGTGQSPLA